ncbi:hypothetical protein I9W82_003211 [Candida metapsilosis]|uniref:Vacuolar sorting protein Vps3844 C-terminal domain-containing protein n=1 Tax=Candida metapsilosis TaxID=273372 RepID=A0A8H7ZFZ1_9ASCO|nr:hypothetical protein I9W82_003211 [Candida metapsilosis]
MKFASAITWSLVAISSFGISEAAIPSHSLNFPVVRNVEHPKIECSSTDEEIYFNEFLSIGFRESYPLTEAIIPAYNQLLEYKLSFQAIPGFETFMPNIIVNILDAELNIEPSFKSKTLQYKFDFWSSRSYMEKVTDAISTSDRKLLEYFQYFPEQTSKIWQNHQANLKQNILNYSPTNDEQFIHELSSLVHLLGYVKGNEEFGVDIYIQISSLSAIKNKIGENSTTYKHAVESLENVLALLAEDCKILVIESPSTSIPESHLKKRSKVRSSTAPAFQFASKQACEVATDKCSAHGECKENKNQWSCVCEPSFNKTTSKTTTWVGPDCGKKDVSVPANLFLWTTIALVLAMVGGIKLLASVGSDPLPGVLDAATLPTKKTI